MPPRDDPITVVAIGLLAYASADIAHHVLGHGGACLALGGRIVSLSSIYVNCTVRGSTVDLAGPFANLILGLTALSAAQWRPSNRSDAATLFFGLAASFNLFWFFLQLAFSAATRSDDWAFALQHFHISEPVRYGLIAAGLVGYGFTIRLVAASLAGFMKPVTRARRIVWAAWLTGGSFACLTALMDPTPVPAILHHAAPQSFGLAIGLLLIPRQVATVAVKGSVEPALPLSLSWIAAALLVAVAPVVWLGPGFAV